MFTEAIARPLHTSLRILVNDVRTLLYYEHWTSGNIFMYNKFRTQTLLWLLHFCGLHQFSDMVPWKSEV